CRVCYLAKAISLTLAHGQDELARQYLHRRPVELSPWEVETRRGVATQTAEGLGATTQAPTRLRPSRTLHTLLRKPGMDALRPITLHSHRDMGMAIHQQGRTGTHPPAIHTIKVAITGHGGSLLVAGGAAAAAAYGAHHLSHGHHGHGGYYHRPAGYHHHYGGKFKKHGRYGYGHGGKFKHGKHMRLFGGKHGLFGGKHKWK
uniref:Uncharacterized protein n=1 Tax=Aegilops tauschii subsp. strangulata TaxID=200361 RepID=A0A453HS24_AEGTS